MQRYYPERILIEESVADTPLAQRVVTRCPDAACETISDVPGLIKEHRRCSGSRFEKTTLLICRNRGRFIEPCPGTREYICCGYTILTPGIGCPLDCTYCVLQAYLNNPFVTLYANTDDMAVELRDGIPQGVVRLGTGEFMDSLALDHLTDFSVEALPLIAEWPGLVLELKTKTDNIGHLLNLDHRGAYIVSWSLSTEAVAGREENGAAPVPQRIEAARTLVRRGYRVGFHFDPVLWYPEAGRAYCDIIALLEQNIPAESVAWISIGSLRYMPQLKKIAQHRFPATNIYTGEFVPGRDGKMRYLQEIRLELYRDMVARLRQWSPKVFVYFCMENDAVWQRALGFSPGGQCESLKAMLDRRTGR